MAKKSNQPDLEKSLTEISLVIEKMERGDTTLEQSLDYFERGITLIKHAQTILQEAEQKVGILTQQNNEEQLNEYKSIEE